MTILHHIQTSIKENLNKNAFFIDDQYYSYNELNEIVSSIRYNIRTKSDVSNKILGLVTHNDIYTYASIIALWLEGKGYVPINPTAPASRNIEIMEMTGSKFLLTSSSDHENYNQFNVITTAQLEECPIALKFIEPSLDDIAYILFTSGSTGTPKGVPITFSNLNSFVLAIDKDPNFKLVSSDRCLQMFELTFDFSVVSLLLPLLSGACVYTIPDKAIKYFYIIKLLKEKQLTVLSLVPSMIHYLRPYFDEITAPSVKYCSFGGSQLEETITEEWSKCIPNASIFNYYGPTECTIYSTCYRFKRNAKNKSNNGVLSIGKPLHNLDIIIVDENGMEAASNKIGELCISGDQVTPGYWKDDEKNMESFFYRKTDLDTHRYYKSGDLCYKDKDGDIMYVGRSDFQVKIRGYRIELGEVEFQIKKKFPNLDIVAIDITNSLGNTELALAIKAKEFNSDLIVIHLKTKLPWYMVPTQFLFLPEIPLNKHGKIDRNAIRLLFNNQK